MYRAMGVVSPVAGVQRWAGVGAAAAAAAALVFHATAKGDTLPTLIRTPSTVFMTASPSKTSTVSSYFRWAMEKSLSRGLVPSG